MKRATIILSFESLKKILDIPESINITNIHRMETDLNRATVTVFVEGGSLHDIPQGTEAPFYPIERLKEFG